MKAHSDWERGDWAREKGKMVLWFVLATFAVSAAAMIYQGQDQLYRGFTRDHFLYWGWFFAAYAFAGVGLVSWVRSRNVVLSPLDWDLLFAEGGIKNQFMVGVFVNFVILTVCWLFFNVVVSKGAVSSRLVLMTPTIGCIAFGIVFAIKGFCHESDLKKSITRA